MTDEKKAELLETLRIAEKQKIVGSAEWWWKKRIQSVRDAVEMLDAAHNEIAVLRRSISALTDLLVKTNTIEDAKKVEMLEEISRWKPA